MSVYPQYNNIIIFLNELNKGHQDPKVREGGRSGQIWRHLSAVGNELTGGWLTEKNQGINCHI
jgi:hypothetical protein